MYCKLLKKNSEFVQNSLFYRKTELMKNKYLDLLNTSDTRNMNR